MATRAGAVAAGALIATITTIATIPTITAAEARDVCIGFGPQAPRDIAGTEGRNRRTFMIAPPASRMNLCNIHFHNAAEHKGPGFRVFAGGGEHGGYRCNGTADLSAAELSPPVDPTASARLAAPAHGGGGHGEEEAAAGEHGSDAGEAGGEAAMSGCAGIKPGDTIEVHWVHSTCAVMPGPGLEACSNANCVNPELRVEAQVFLVVNDPEALDFMSFAEGAVIGGLHQAAALPTGTGTPVVFTGSTTGPKYTERKCSPLQVTWSVRPNCAKVDIASLNAWCRANAFKENHAHGVRQLVTAPELLSPIP